MAALIDATQRAAKVIEQIEDPDAQRLFELTLLWCDCDQLKGADGPTEANASQHAELALSCLQQAIDAGFLDAQRLNSEERFSHLRNNEAFVKLVRQTQAISVVRGWHTDLESAQEIAREADKDLLIMFNGSDWCIFCATVQGQVLDQDAFLDAVTKQFVLVNLDSPMFQPKPPHFLRDQRLRGKWKIRSVPHFVVCDPDMRRIAKRGRSGSVQEWIQDLDRIHQRRVQRDTALQQAEEVQSSETLHYLALALDQVDKQFHEQDYGDISSKLQAYIRTGPHELDLEQTDPLLLKTIAAGSAAEATRIQNIEADRAELYREQSDQIYSYLYQRIPNDPEVAVAHAKRRQREAIPLQREDWSPELKARGALIPSLDPISGEWLFVGSIHYLLGESERAVSCWNRVGGKQEPAAAVLSSACLLELNQHRQAKASFQQFWESIAQHGTSSLTPKMLDRIVQIGGRWPEISSLERRAAFAVHQRRFGEALRLYQQLLDQEPLNDEWSRRVKLLEQSPLAASHFDFGLGKILVVGGARAEHLPSRGIMRLTQDTDDFTGVKFLDAIDAGPGRFYELTIRLQTLADSNASMLLFRDGKLQSVVPLQIPTSAEMADTRVVFHTNEGFDDLRIGWRGGIQQELFIDTVALTEVDLDRVERWVRDELERDATHSHALALASLCHIARSHELTERGNEVEAIKELDRAEATLTPKLDAFLIELELAESRPRFNLMELVEVVKQLHGIVYSRVKLRDSVEDDSKHRPPWSSELHQTADPMSDGLKLMIVRLADAHRLDGQQDRADLVLSLLTAVPSRGARPGAFEGRASYAAAIVRYELDQQSEFQQLMEHTLEVISSIPGANESEFAYEALTRYHEAKPGDPRVVAALTEAALATSRFESLDDLLKAWEGLQPQAKQNPRYNAVISSRMTDELHASVAAGDDSRVVELVASIPPVQRFDSVPMEALDMIAGGQYVESSRSDAPRWQYRFTPVPGWKESVDWNDDSWRVGLAPIASSAGRIDVIRSDWPIEHPDIWLRTEVTLDPSRARNAKVRTYIDDQAEVYINGELVLTQDAWRNAQYHTANLPKRLLRRGRNVIAVHCRNTDGPGVIDVGVRLLPKPEALDRVLTAAIEDHPASVQLHRKRAANAVHLGDLSTAANDYTVAARCAQGSLHSLQAASIYAHLGDQKRYEAVCREMGSKSYVPEQYVKALCILPDAFEVDELPLDDLYTQVSQEERFGTMEWVSIAIALAELRRGDLEKSREAIERISVETSDGAKAAVVYAVRALLEFHDGNPDEMQAMRRMLDETLNRKRQYGAMCVPWMIWGDDENFQHDFLIADSLQTELESLIQGPAYAPAKHGHIAMIQEDWVRAADAFEQALQLSPNAPAVLQRLAANTGTSVFRYDSILENGRASPIEWEYRSTNPGQGWRKKQDRDTDGWRVGNGPFGSRPEDGRSSVPWPDSQNLWLRTEFTVDQIPESMVAIRCICDDNATFFINGIEAASAHWSNDYGWQTSACDPKAVASIRSDQPNTLAIRCKNYQGRNWVEVDLVTMHQTAPIDDWIAKLRRREAKVTVETALASAAEQMRKDRWDLALSSFEMVFDDVDSNQTVKILATCAAGVIHGQVDQSDYDRLCERATARWRGSDSVLDIERMLKACLLLPEAEIDISDLQPGRIRDAIQEGTVRTEFVPWLNLCCAMYAFRTGAFADAEQFAEAALASESGNNSARDANAYAVIAFSMQARKQLESAKEFLHKATDALGEQASLRDDYSINGAAAGLGNGVNHDLLISQLWIREAALAVAGPPSSPPNLSKNAP